MNNNNKLNYMKTNEWPKYYIPYSYMGFVEL